MNLSTFLKAVKKRVAPSAKDLNVRKWYRDHGETTHRLSFDIAAGSTVVDLGGYEGQWASDMFSRYLCTVHVFEPVTIYADKMRAQFAHNSKICVHEVALGSQKGSAIMDITGPGSTAVATTSGQPFSILPAAEWLNEHIPGRIAVMKMNIEGGEYDLLPHLIESGWIHKIDNLVVQFHDTVPGWKDSMASIISAIDKTHNRTFSYPVVWEGWRIKG